MVLEGTNELSENDELREYELSGSDNICFSASDDPKKKSSVSYENEIVYAHAKTMTST